MKLGCYQAAQRAQPHTPPAAEPGLTPFTSHFFTASKPNKTITAASQAHSSTAFVREVPATKSSFVFLFSISKNFGASIPLRSIQRKITLIISTRSYKLSLKQPHVLKKPDPQTCKHAFGATSYSKHFTHHCNHSISHILSTWIRCFLHQLNLSPFTPLRSSLPRTQAKVGEDHPRCLGTEALPEDWQETLLEQ